MTWIVMTASAAMPQSCRGRYRRVALVKVNPEAGRMPLKIDVRDKAVEKVIDYGKHNVGKTSSCAYERAKADAELHMRTLNMMEGERVYG